MEDNEIIQLYCARDSRAIDATAEKYGSYCHSIAHNILKNQEDAEECVSGIDNVEQEFDRKALLAAINTFLGTLPTEHCNIFLSRYWYTLSVKEIAKKFGKTQGNISTLLNRIRKKLKEYLKEGGFEL